MQVSARNCLKGTVTSVNIGSVNTEITLEIAPGFKVVSIITKASAEQLELTVGKEAYAVIKASDVLMAIND
ncbi:molybdopterin-binding protein [Synechocystis sp. LKSZ1]|uniref:TOBE domain-containing protein n=1 Tax=Synechocystis sp. LKSZ1 TaxID=3144951 RepID=UPI00336BCEB0